MPSSPPCYTESQLKTHRRISARAGSGGPEIVGADLAGDRETGELSPRARQLTSQVSREGIAAQGPGTSPGLAHFARTMANRILIA